MSEGSKILSVFRAHYWLLGLMAVMLSASILAQEMSVNTKQNSGITMSAKELKALLGNAESLDDYRVILVPKNVVDSEMTEQKQLGRLDLEMTSGIDKMDLPPIYIPENPIRPTPGKISDDKKPHFDLEEFCKRIPTFSQCKDLKDESN